MSEKLNVKRPEVGYLSRVRLFESARPKPAEEASRQFKPLYEAPESIKQVPEAEESLRLSGLKK